MRKVKVLVNNIFAGELEEINQNNYRFIYVEDYQGPPVSLTMPIDKAVYEFNQFPPFFDGLLPEGAQLEALLRHYKLDKKDYLGQLLQVGNDLVGAITIEQVI